MILMAVRKAHGHDPLVMGLEEDGPLGTGQAGDDRAERVLVAVPSGDGGGQAGQAGGGGEEEGFDGDHVKERLWM